MTKHKFVLSSQLFSGYTKYFHSDEIESIELIADKIKQSLMATLKELNLDILIDELKKLKFHHHDYTLIDVLQSTDQEHSWYICECSH